MKGESIKHLEFIQNIIARMAGNSFLLKGWSITLAAALFALAEKDANENFALLALFPAVAFWLLDAYYLRQERLYRQLYDAVCNTSGQEQPAPSVGAFSLETSPWRRKVGSVLRLMWALPVVLVHGTIILVVAIVVLTMN